MKEKRRYPRFELKISAKYKILSTEEFFKLTRIKNISAEGLCFESDEELSIGTHVSLEVDLKDGKAPVSVAGEIRWSKPEGEKKKCLNGVKLIDMVKVDEARFLKYYCDKMVEKLSGYLAI